MKKIVIKGFKCDAGIIKKLDVFFCNEGNLVILPTLFSLFLRLKQVVFIRKNLIDSSGEVGRELVKSYITEGTVDLYLNYLLKYLQFIEDTVKKQTNTVSVHLNEVVTQKVINYYVNDVLVLAHGAGTSSVTSTISALNAYYNWLAYSNLSLMVDIFLQPANKERAEKNTRRKQAVKYISTDGRFKLLKNCLLIRDELLMCMGFLVGLRSKENCGLLLNDFTYNKVRQLGLISLFNQLKSNKSQQVFVYFLAGIYTKGGGSRKIYFNRRLLERMLEYYLTERAEIMNNEGLNHDKFFVKIDNQTRGQPIKNDTATNRFSVLKKGILSIGHDNSYQDLRHSFATDLFHSKLNGEPAINIGCNHPAIIEVAIRLGHKIDNPNTLKLVTYRYIRLHKEMMSVEGYYV